jgi:hypothetical protein
MADVPVPQASCADTLEMRQRVISTMSNAFTSRGMLFIDWNMALLQTAGIDDPTKFSNLRGFHQKISGGYLNYRGHEVFATALTDVITKFQSLTADSPKRN